MAEGIPTSRGKRVWYPATIRAVVESDNADDLEAHHRAWAFATGGLMHQVDTADIVVLDGFHVAHPHETT